MKSNIELIINIFQLKQDNDITDSDIVDKFMECSDNNVLKEVYEGLLNDIKFNIQEVEF